MKVVPSTRVESSRGPVLLYSSHHIFTGCVLLLWDFCRSLVVVVVVVFFYKQSGDWLPGCRVFTRRTYEGINEFVSLDVQRPASWHRVWQQQ